MRAGRSDADPETCLKLESLTRLSYYFFPVRKRGRQGSATSSRKCRVSEQHARNAGRILGERFAHIRSWSLLAVCFGRSRCASGSRSRSFVILARSVRRTIYFKAISHEKGADSRNSKQLNIIYIFVFTSVSIFCVPSYSESG